MTHLPYGRQTIDDDDLAAVAEALHAPLLTCGPLVAWFEAALAGWPGAPHATVCSSGTAALHLAYAALGIGAGDEIITTPITFSATAAAAYYAGATVRIAGVAPRTGNRSPASVEPLINRRTRAILAEEVRRTSDLGDVLVIWPELQLHGTLSGARPGTPVPDDVCSSDRAEPRLDLEATRAMVERVA